jgi:hypothetical protein
MKKEDDSYILTRDELQELFNELPPLSDDTSQDYDDLYTYIETELDEVYTCIDTDSDEDDTESDEE